MSYTKKNISVIALMLLILIFICIYLTSLQISFLFTSQNNSKEIYSKTIPIKEQNSELSLASIKSDIGYNLSEKSEKLNTQREVTKENINNTWRIEIPKIGLNAHIMEGTDQDILLKSVGHFEYTSTWNGNVCLAAHNRGYLCNFFEKIKNLKIGDEIIYYTEEGEKVYKVQINKVILATDWSYIEETENNKITLITCEENRSEYRRCVQAVQILEL